MSFASDVLIENKKRIVDTYNIQSGLDFNDLKVLSEVSLFNRFGETTIQELQLLQSNAKKNDASDFSVAFVSKKLFDETNPSDYEKNYQQFTNYIENLNQIWEKSKKKLTNLDPFYPDQLSNAKIESVKDGIIVYHTLNRFVKRDKSGIPANMRYKIMGYALGRFHSQEYTKVSLDPYKSYFAYLKESKVDKKIVDNWEKTFEKIKGSSYILGDCSLENVQYNALEPGKGKLDSICYVDPVFLNNRDRYEDISGILASLGREIVYNALVSKPEGSLRELLAKTFRAIMDASKEILSSYKLIHPDFFKQTAITADFFTGTFLLQYSGQFNGQDKFSSSFRDELQVLGTQFLTDQPINESLKN